MANQELVQKNFMNLSPEKIELLKRTICKGSSNDELELFLHMCKQTGLDPFMKQIHAIKRKTKEGDVMTVQTSIDGMRLIADRTGNYVPGGEPKYVWDNEKKLISASVCVKKRTADGQWHEVWATAFYTEYVQRFFNAEKREWITSNFWERMPHVMLAKCAEALALRKAFPAEMSGLYSSEEMEQSKVEEIVSPAPKLDKKERLNLLQSQIDALKNSGENQ